MALLARAQNSSHRCAPREVRVPVLFQLPSTAQASAGSTSTGAGKVVPVATSPVTEIGVPVQISASAWSLNSSAVCTRLSSTMRRTMSLVAAVLLP